MFAKTYLIYSIISGEMDTFAFWLLQELDNRRWTQAELHRRSGMSKTVISDVLSETAKPGWDFCVGIAKAFNIPPENVMRIAGLLAKISELTEQKATLIYLFDQLSLEKQQDLLDLADFWVNKE